MTRNRAGWRRWTWAAALGLGLGVWAAACGDEADDDAVVVCTAQTTDCAECPAGTSCTEAAPECYVPCDTKDDCSACEEATTCGYGTGGRQQCVVMP